VGHVTEFPNQLFDLRILEGLLPPAEIEPSFLSEEWYCFGRGLLQSAVTDIEFALRFRRIFSECRCPPNRVFSLPRVQLAVHRFADRGFVAARIQCPAEVDLPVFIQELFPSRNYKEVGCSEAGWRVLAEKPVPCVPVLAFRDGWMVAPADYGWQAVVGHCAVSLVMMLQKDMLFFHAASVAIGEKGVLIFGEKGAGKTTLSLALADRNHAFLGDEYAALATADFRLLPFRRTASIREGPRSERVDSFLARCDCPVEVNTDGTMRRRAAVGEIFPAAAAHPARLTDVFFLRGFAPRPKVEHFTPDLQSFPLLAPLLCTVWGMRAGERVLEFLKLLSRARCFMLLAGGHPDETAELVERIVEDHKRYDCA